MALQRIGLYAAAGTANGVVAPASRRAWRSDDRLVGSAAKPRAGARVERTPVQILVVVANIQVRPLKTEVEKGSM